MSEHWKRTWSYLYFLLLILTNTINLQGCCWQILSLPLLRIEGCKLRYDHWYGHWTVTAKYLAHFWWKKLDTSGRRMVEVSRFIIGMPCSIFNENLSRQQVTHIKHRYWSLLAAQYCQTCLSPDHNLSANTELSVVVNSSQFLKLQHKIF